MQVVCCAISLVGMRRSQFNGANHKWCILVFRDKHAKTLSLREMTSPKCSSLSHCDAKHWNVFVNMFLCDFISFVTFSTGFRKYPTIENVKNFILSQMIMFSLIRSDESVFCCIEEIKLLLALNRLRVQSRIVLECMLSVLSIDMFVDLNSFVYTFRTGFHSIFNGARFCLWVV